MKGSRASAWSSWPRVAALLVMASPLAGGVGCSGASHAPGKATTASAASSAPTSGAAAASDGPNGGPVKADADRDDDVGAPYDDTNNRAALDFGSPVSPADARAVEALVRRYYGVALAENGAQACSLIDSILAESAPEDYGQSPPGPSYMVGKTCPAVATALFRHFHGRLAAELPRLHVASVRLQRNVGWALVTFGVMPMRRMAIRRELGHWKIGELLDAEIP